MYWHSAGAPGIARRGARPVDCPACLALGVAVIAAVGACARRRSGLAADGRRILGGDLEVNRFAGAAGALRDWLRARGASFRRHADALHAGGASGQRQLVELKAVDSAWPLVGKPAHAPSNHGAGPGDDIRTARGTSRARTGWACVPGTASGWVTPASPSGQLCSEPDRVASPLILGPRVLIADVADHRVADVDRVTGGDPSSSSASAFITGLREAFPGQGWRIRVYACPARPSAAPWRAPARAPRPGRDRR